MLEKLSGVTDKQAQAATSEIADESAIETKAVLSEDSLEDIAGGMTVAKPSTGAAPSEIGFKHSF